MGVGPRCCPFLQTVFGGCAEHCGQYLLRSNRTRFAYNETSGLPFPESLEEVWGTFFSYRYDVAELCLADPAALEKNVYADFEAEWGVGRDLSKSVFLHGSRGFVLEPEHLATAPGFWKFSLKNAVVSVSASVKLWDLNTGSIIKDSGPLGGGSYPVVSAAFSPDGFHVLAATQASLQLWNVRTGQVVAQILMPSSPVIGDYGMAVYYSSKGKNPQRILVSAAQGCSLVELPGIGDILSASDWFSSGAGTMNTTATFLKWIPGGGAPGGRVVGHADRELVLTTEGPHHQSSSAEARLWSVEVNNTPNEDFNATLLRTFSSHNGSVVWADFSPDGSLVVTASTDKTAKVWNTSSGDLIQTLAPDAGLQLVSPSLDTQASSASGAQTPEKAVDGNSGGAMYHSNTEHSPWWAVDLGNDYDIVSVKLWNRVGSCASRLFSGSGCSSSNPAGVYDGSSQGATIGVGGGTSWPCSGDACTGTVCGRLTESNAAQQYEVVRTFTQL